MRNIGTISMGIRCPIIREGDDIENIVVNSVIDAVDELHDKDVIAITESIVARAQGNYCTVEDIADNLRCRFPDIKTVGVVFPILSRNRFSLILKGIARAFGKVVLQLSYPTDEVGNALMDESELFDAGVNPYTDCFTEEEFRNKFSKYVHPFTGVDYIDYYKSIIEEEGSESEIIFCNDPVKILSKATNVIVADIHTAQKTTTRIILSNEFQNHSEFIYLLGLSGIMDDPEQGCGYNLTYGVLGSNKASDEVLKLFPRNAQELVVNIQHKLYLKTGKNVEVMVYGDGAFKDPVGGIWEFADPVVSPFFTKGLYGTPNELKLKYLADNEFSNLNGSELKDAILDKIKSKENNLVGKMDSEGTTPRQLTDLIGSLCDLTSGSGDKGTPIVLVRGYFDNYASE